MEERTRVLVPGSKKEGARMEQQRGKKSSEIGFCNFSFEHVAEKNLLRQRSVRGTLGGERGTKDDHLQRVRKRERASGG